MIKNRRPLFRLVSKEWGILFSSGSTGVSKAIVYDHSAMSSELLAWCLELGIRRETTILHWTAYTLYRRIGLNISYFVGWW